MAAKTPKTIPAPPPPPAPPSVADAATPPAPPAPPPPAPPTAAETTGTTNGGEIVTENEGGDNQAGGATLGETPPAPPPDADELDNENGPVTTDAEHKGAVLATDALDENGDRKIPTDPAKRGDAISKLGYEDGLSADLKQNGEGRKPREKRRDWNDSEYDRYIAGYNRGVQQNQADNMSVEDRLARLERAAGLVSPAE